MNTHSTPAVLWVVLLISIALNIALLVMVSKKPNDAQSLADAIVLLDHPEQAVAGRQIADNRYWVWVKATDQERSPQEESWIVDVQRNSAERVSSRNFGPAGGNAWVNDMSDRYLEIDWSGG